MGHAIRTCTIVLPGAFGFILKSKNAEPLYFLFKLVWRFPGILLIPFILYLLH